MMMKLLAASALLLSPLMSAACGDDGGGGGTVTADPFQSESVEDTGTVAGELSAAERDAFCQELATYFDQQVPPATQRRITCYFLGAALSGGNREACEATAEACLDDAELEVSGTDLECDQARLDGCTATVAELQACFTDTTSVVKTIASRLSCSMSAADFQAYEDKPASCQAVEAKCPNLFVDEDDTDTER